MDLLMALLTGLLYACGLYMMLRRSMVKLVVGISLLGQAANMLIFTLGGMENEQPPLILPTQDVLTGNFADPLPQALILTAIVIGFGVQAFAVVLVRQAFQTACTDDLDQLRTTDS